MRTTVDLPDGPATLGTSERTGLTTITLGRVVTSDDVGALDDDA